MITATKERGIIFSAQMVRAILAGTKTQTRRVVKPQPGTDINPIRLRMAVPMRRGDYEYLGAESNPAVEISIKPYAFVGDHLWVREKWCPRSGGMLAMDSICRPRFAATEELRPEWGFKWKSPLHLPRKLSRITLDITSLRVERLCSISERDAKAEGMTVPLTEMRYAHEFYLLWEKLNGKKHPWASNPWVWAISFKCIEQTAIA